MFSRREEFRRRCESHADAPCVHAPCSISLTALMARGLHRATRRPTMRQRDPKTTGAPMARLKWAVLVAVALVATASAMVRAEDYPVRPIRLIVPFAPGGGNDTLARLYGQKMSESLG